MCVRSVHARRRVGLSTLAECLFSLTDNGPSCAAGRHRTHARCRGARSGVRCAPGLGGACNVSNLRCTKLIRCRQCPPSSRRQSPPLRASTSHAYASWRNRYPLKSLCRPAGGRRACSRHHVALWRIGRLTDAIVPELCTRLLQGERWEEVFMPRATAATYTHYSVISVPFTSPVDITGTTGAPQSPRDRGM